MSIITPHISTLLPLSHEELEAFEKLKKAAPELFTLEAQQAINAKKKLITFSSGGSNTAPASITDRRVYICSEEQALRYLRNKNLEVAVVIPLLRKDLLQFRPANIPELITSSSIENALKGRSWRFLTLTLCGRYPVMYLDIAKWDPTKFDCDEYLRMVLYFMEKALKMIDLVGEACVAENKFKTKPAGIMRLPTAEQVKKEREEKEKKMLGNNAVANSSETTLKKSSSSSSTALTLNPSVSSTSVGGNNNDDDQSPTASEKEAQKMIANLMPENYADGDDDDIPEGWSKNEVNELEMDDSPPEKSEAGMKSSASTKKNGSSESLANSASTSSVITTSTNDGKNAKKETASNPATAGKKKKPSCASQNKALLNSVKGTVCDLNSFSSARKIIPGPKLDAPEEVAEKKSTYKYINESKIVLLMDMENWELWHIKYITYIRKMLTTLQNHYGGLMIKTFFINAPTFFSAAFKLTKPFINAATVKKIGFVNDIATNPAEMQRVLKCNIDKKSLPVKFGGCENGREVMRQKFGDLLEKHDM